MELSTRDHSTLERLEEELWREATRFDIKRMEQVMAPDFCEFGRSGRIYTRQDILAVPRQAIDAVLPLPDLAVRLLQLDVAQVTYNSSVTHAGAVQHARRSSIWSRTPDGWVLRFHQGTPFGNEAEESPAAAS